ncbi:uncharacterized protein LOC119436183 [Dermacentor silvarum]|uniref:uncharacterized protein LOC119436183 n=1 Tax=Dermacentor silvarum TaxID=543639 RepID=UPI0021018469|nr:uncharacterized protein LOC119436183 [Dermacentor silvarum]
MLAAPETHMGVSASGRSRPARCTRRPLRVASRLAVVRDARASPPPRPQRLPRLSHRRASGEPNLSSAECRAEGGSRSASGRSAFGSGGSIERIRACVRILLGRWCARDSKRRCSLVCLTCHVIGAGAAMAPRPEDRRRCLLLGNCLVVVCRRVGSDDDQDEASAQDRAGPPGWSLFRGFVHENAQCFWNQCLVQSVACLEYRGYLIPSTIFVSGNEYTLEVVRSAWSRRVLRPPVGYEIQKLGESPALRSSNRSRQRLSFFLFALLPS